MFLKFFEKSGSGKKATWSREIMLILDIFSFLSSIQRPRHTIRAWKIGIGYISVS